MGGRGNLGSRNTATAVDLYFKTDWEEGTGPNSVSFKEGLAAGKRWMQRDYSWGELVEAVQSEYYLSQEETSVLEDKLKMYAIQHGEYTELHNTWRENFKRRNIPITGRRTKVEIEVDKMRK